MIAPVLPMLAAQAKPFNSAEYFFEVKWDGIRALAAVEEGGWQLWGRGLADYRPRYPELAVLTALPAGTLVDGELVAFQDGLPRLGAVLQRHQLVDSLKIRQASRQRPVNYVLFDLLAVRGRCLLREPFLIRRGLLRDLLDEHKLASLLLSDGVSECGERFFAQAVAQGHEGVMAKHQASRYWPGQRSGQWKKIKPDLMVPCVILGYTPGRQGFHSLLVASSQRGPLRYVAEVTAGFRREDRPALAQRLASLRSTQPTVPCAKEAVWVHPELFCRVRFQQWTLKGRLLGASFHSLVEDHS